LMRGERSKAIEFGNFVIVGSLAILHKVTEDQFNRSWILFQKLSGAGLSFTDCTSHIVANDLKVPSVASSIITLKRPGVSFLCLETTRHAPSPLPARRCSELG
jgi:hypothetical protein